MSAQIPFSSETFRPISIINNDKAENPVEFDICAVGGPARAALKSVIVATGGLAATGNWSPDVQDAVIAAFKNGGQAFVDGVTKVRGLTAPAALCVKVGLLAELPKGMDENTQIPITNGLEYSRVAGYWPMLSFEVGMALARISGQAEIDPRFFAWLSISLGLPASPPGTAKRAERKRAPKGTAGSRTPKGGRAAGT